MSNKKKIQDFEKLLGKYIKNREVIKIERKVTEGESNINGVILKKSNHFLQIIETDEFNFNGQIIIKKEDFDSIRCNEFDKTYKKIMEKEGILNKENLLGNDIDLTDWNSIFGNLMEKDIHVIIECEDLKKPTFTIGPIEKINNKSVEIRNYDPTGNLETKTTRIKFKNITLLKYNDRYSLIFRKYLKKSNKKSKNAS